MVRFPAAVLCGLLTGAAAAATLEGAEHAVTEVLFDTDVRNAWYSVRDDGFVDILFGIDVPEWQYQDALRRLQSHPGVKGVLASRASSNFCPLR